MQVKFEKEKIAELITDFNINKHQLAEKYKGAEIPISEAAELLAKYNNNELMYLSAYAMICGHKRGY